MLAVNIYFILIFDVIVLLKHYFRIFLNIAWFIELLVVPFTTGLMVH